VSDNAAPAQGILYQLHWQNRSNYRETEFVAQCGVNSFEELDAWATEVVSRRRSECPDGWVPMVCGQGSEHFVLAAAEEVKA
jgi:hypothetical protein